jgi:HD-GYP domain-containing protein (c-di-GMP phosphodiesterase class II)
MTHERPYRQGMDVGAAANELRRTRGGQFEPDLVDLLLEILREPRWAEDRSVNARSADADFADAFLRGLHAGSLSGAVGG